jgi:hypothetical protein
MLHVRNLSRWLGHETTNTNIATAELEPITENYVQSDESK